MSCLEMSRCNHVANLLFFTENNISSISIENWPLWRKAFVILHSWKLMTIHYCRHINDQWIGNALNFQLTECSLVLEFLADHSTLLRYDQWSCCWTIQYVAEGFLLQIEERWCEGGLGELMFYLDLSGRPWHTTMVGVHAPRAAMLSSGPASSS